MALGRCSKDEAAWPLDAPAATSGSRSPDREGTPRRHAWRTSGLYLGAAADPPSGSPRPCPCRVPLCFLPGCALTVPWVHDEPPAGRVPREAPRLPPSLNDTPPRPSPMILALGARPRLPTRAGGGIRLQRGAKSPPLLSTESSLLWIAESTGVSVRP